MSQAMRESSKLKCKQCNRHLGDLSQTEARVFCRNCMGYTHFEMDAEFRRIVSRTFEEKRRQGESCSRLTRVPSGGRTEPDPARVV